MSAATGRAPRAAPGEGHASRTCCRGRGVAPAIHESRYVPALWVRSISAHEHWVPAQAPGMHSVSHRCPRDAT